MKLKSTIYLIVLLIFTIESAAQEGNYKVFPFESAIITYEQTGSTTGTHIKYIDKYGYIQADYTETTTKVYGTVTTENKAVILKGQELFNVDYEKETVTITQNPVYETYANSGNPDYDKIGKQALASLGYTNTGEKDVVVGKSCEIWQGPTGKIWLWQSLTLKSVTTMFGITFTEVATKIEVGVSIPSDKLDIPEGFEVKKVDMPMNGLNNMYDDAEIDDSDDDTEEDIEEMKKIAKMPYAEFRLMVLKEDPDMTEEEIKLTHEMIKQRVKIYE